MPLVLLSLSAEGLSWHTYARVVHLLKGNEFKLCCRIVDCMKVSIITAMVVRVTEMVANTLNVYLWRSHNVTMVTVTN